VRIAAAALALLLAACTGPTIVYHIAPGAVEIETIKPPLMRLLPVRPAMSSQQNQR
jgi:hypothetical protein